MTRTLTIGAAGRPALFSLARHASPPATEFYPLFDYLRIALALGVFVAHADRDHLLPGQFGNACVQVFFALSGFLIGGILVRNTLKDLPRFYYNRTTRIWIPYFLAIGILLLGCLLKRQPFDGKLLEFFFYKATFVYNTFGVDQLEHARLRMPLESTGNHFWSICVEEQFYLMAPLVVILWPRGRVAILILAWLVNFVFPHNFAAMSLGVLLALSQKNYGDWFAQSRMQAALLAVLGLSIGAMLVGFVSYDTVAPVAALCVVALLARRGKQLPMGQLLGGVSYPFYLNHWIGLCLRKPVESALGLPPIVGDLLGLAAALAVSTLLYLLVDRTIQARRSRWYSPRVAWWCSGLGAAVAGIGLLGGLAFQVWPPR
jgi:peptidoglycan/LPS O-acetylase OafA/YrhL